MIKTVVKGVEDRPALVIALTREDLERLLTKLAKPGLHTMAAITIKGQAFGLPVDTIIFGGETTQDCERAISKGIQFFFEWCLTEKGRG